MKDRPWKIKWLTGLLALGVGWLAFFAGLLIIRGDIEYAFKLGVRGTRAASWFALGANVGFLLVYVFNPARSFIWRMPWCFLIPPVASYGLAVGILYYWHEPLGYAWQPALMIAIPALSAYLTACWLNYRSLRPGAG